MKAGTWKSEHSFRSVEKNYYPWLTRIMQFLRQRKLDLLALGKIVPNEKWSLESLERYEIDLEIVKNALMQSVDDEVIQATSRATHPHEILDYMKTTYADNTEIQKQNLMYEMSNLHYVDGAPIEDHISKFQILINKMINAGMQYSEQRKINCFLDTLPTSWRIEKRSYLSKLSTLHEVLAQTKGTAMDMVNERMDQGKGRGTSQALLTQQDNTSSQIEIYNADTRTRQNYRRFQSFNERAKDYERMNKCIYCNRPNHSIATCNMKARHDQERNQASNYSGSYNGNRNRSRSRSYRSPSANIASESKQEEERLPQSDDEEETKQTEVNPDSNEGNNVQSPWDCLLVTMALTAGMHLRSNDWVLDSGCTHHMCYNPDLFMTKLTPMEEEVFLGDGYSIKIEGVGTAQINTRNSQGNIQPIILRRCFYVPKLKRNLISLGEMAKDKIHIDFNTDINKVILSKGGSSVYAYKENGGNLYLVKGIEQTGKLRKRVHFENPVATEFSSALIAETTLEMRHRRLGHLGFDNVQRLSTTGRWKMKGNENPAKGVCDVCTRANLKRSSMKRKKSKFPHVSTVINELIFTDLKGPIEVPTFGGKRYLLLFVDDYSNYVHTYFLRTKDEALSQFKLHYTFVLTQHGHKVQHVVKAVNSDGGGEFNSTAWIQFCQDKGIRRRLTTAHTPEMNGKAEVRFRTLFERVRAMLMDANLPKQCWGFAVEYATAIMNVSPSSKRKQTPYEMWQKNKFDYDTLRTFGCIGYAHVTKTHKKAMHETAPDNTTRKTLDNRGICGIFVGFSELRKAWKFRNCRTMKVFDSCSAVFNEANTEETLRIKREELTSLQQLTKLNFDYNSKYATQPTELLFYQEHPTEEEALLAALSLYPVEALLGQGESRPQVFTTQSSVPTNLDLLTIVKDDNNESKRMNLEAINKAILIEPKTYEEATSCGQKIHWKEAMNKEGNSLKEHETWTLVPLPIGKEALTARWVFKIKYDANGNVERYKARLVIRGFEQVKYIDFEEIFAPVLRMDALRVLLALVALHDLECHQMDVDTAFLNGDLEEEVYMYQAPGLEEKGKEHLVCKLNKALYGLKQAPRTWYKRLTNHLIKYGFKKVLVDSCVWIKHIEGEICIIGIYVDDLLLISKSTNTMRKLKKMLMSEFKCKDLGEVHYLLGLKITRNRNERQLFISQETYTKSVLEKFGMASCNRCDTPCDTNVQLSKGQSPDKPDEKMHKEYRAIVGSLMYLMTGTRPDIAYAVQSVSRYLSCPGEAHMKAAKRILRYVKGTSDYGILYDGKLGKENIEVYVDSDYAKDVDGRRSTSGYATILAGGVITYSSKLQRTVALSSAEAEYMGLAHGTQEVLFLRELVKEIGLSQDKTVIHVDNQAAQQMAMNPVHHQRTKHIDVRYHFVRERVQTKEIELQHVSTKENLADIMTKGVTAAVLNHLRPKLGICSMENQFN